DVDAHGTQAVEGLTGFFRGAIGDGDEAGKLAVDGDEGRGAAVGGEPFRLLFERFGRDAALPEPGGIADADALALDDASGAMAGLDAEGFGTGKRSLVRSRALGEADDDGACDGVLALPLDCGHEAQKLGLVE